MGHITLILTVIIVHLLAVISPGPDFLIVTKNTLSYSKKAGIWTAAGIGLGIGVHVFYSIAGLALIISKSIFLFNTLKLLGASYLIFIGIKSFLFDSSHIEPNKFNRKTDISSINAAKIGFFTNVLNPKATLFFLSLFTIVIPPDIPISILLIIGIIMMLNTFLWFSFIAICLSHQKVRSVFENFREIIDKTLGGLLIILGIKVVFSHK